MTSPKFFILLLLLNKYNLLHQDNNKIKDKDKVAAVKTVQREDKTRVVSAISAMLGQQRKS